MDLTNSDLIALTELRHTLHRHPEVSGAEAGTAARITAEPSRPTPPIQAAHGARRAWGRRGL